MYLKYKSILPFISVFILAACGGGGGGGGGDGGGASNGGYGTAPINTAPTINNSSNDYSTMEGETSGFMVNASDAEGNSLTYSVSGNDGSKMTVTTSGVVSFVSAPDFEIPGDANGDNIYSFNVSVSDGNLSTAEGFTITVTNNTSDDAAPVTGQNNPNFECNKPYYLSKPDPVATDSAYSYYEYYWQSNPKLCINFRETDLLDDEWETKIPQILNYAKDNLGMIVPLNAFVVDQKNASQATLNQLDVDACNLWFIPQGASADCSNRQDPWGNRSAAAGIGFGQLPNGGDLYFFQDNWADQGDPQVPPRILMHEFYHVYQNSMKFYFEDDGRFGIPKRFENDASYGEGTLVRVFPGWLEEGGADFAGMILATKYDNNIDARKQFEAHLDEAKSVISTAASNSDTLSLKDYEYQGGLYESTANPNNGIARQFAYAYTGGAWAFVYLWSLDNANFKKIIVDYYKNYAEKDKLNPGEGWKDSFEELFGMTMSKFYEDFDAFMLQDKATIMKALKTNAQMQEASFTTGLTAALTFNVSVAANSNGSGNVYVIEGTQNKAITLEVGKTYTFTHPTGHPFKFSTTSNGTHEGGSEYTTGVTTSTAGSTVIEVTANTPTTLYYYCSIHSGMGGTITVSS